jgi:uncharacterized membrane protein
VADQEHRPGRVLRRVRLRGRRTGGYCFPMETAYDRETGSSTRDARHLHKDDGVHLRVRSLIEAVRASFFVVPMAAVVVAVVAGLATVTIDSRFDDEGSDLPLVLASTVESARAILGTIAGATITFAAIAFSVSLLIIQLASSQYSPRVVHTLFRDPFNRRVMGVVIGTFTYCLVVLRSVRSPLEEGGDPVIPNVSVSIAIVLGIAAILAVVAFIDHNAHAMDVSKILERVTRDALEAIPPEWKPVDEQPHRTPEPAAIVPADGRCVRFDQSGWIQYVDVDGLLECMPEGATVLVHTYAGRYAVKGAALCTVSEHDGADVEAQASALRAAVVIGDTRTMQQDISYGLRQLADVALRGLSPGVNDPTTAHDAILHAAAVLAELLRRSPPGRVCDDRGRTALLPEVPGHLELIRLTFEEVRRAAAASPAVCVYLLEAMALLADSTDGHLSPEARDEIRTQARLVVDGCEHADPIPEDLMTVQVAYRSRFT